LLLLWTNCESLSHYERRQGTTSTNYRMVTDVPLSRYRPERNAI
jgi:hypothetical protein